MGFSSSSNRGNAVGTERMGINSAPSMCATSNSTGSRTSTNCTLLPWSSRRFTSWGAISRGRGCVMPWRPSLRAPFRVLGNPAGVRLPANLNIQPLDLLIQRGKRHVQAVGGFGLAPAELFQTFDDDAPLEICHDLE